MNIDKHHRKARSKGGSNSNRNISLVRQDLHVAFHKIFGNASVEEVAKILNDTWIDPDFELIVRRKS